MEEPRLTPTSYAVLGVVALRGATTSYELKRYVAGSLDHFWPIPHAQLYREPKRLVDLGLLAVEEEDGGRRRQFFAITAEGRAALDGWLADPAAEVVELRDAGLAKLHFAALMQPGAREALAATQARLRAERLEDFEAVHRHYREADGARDLHTLEAGIALERAFLAFWKALA